MGQDWDEKLPESVLTADKLAENVARPLVCVVASDSDEFGESVNSGDDDSDKATTEAVKSGDAVSEARTVTEGSAENDAETLSVRKVLAVAIPDRMADDVSDTDTTELGVGDTLFGFDVTAEIDEDDVSVSDAGKDLDADTVFKKTDGVRTFVICDDCDAHVEADVDELKIAVTVTAPLNESVIDAAITDAVSIAVVETEVESDDDTDCTDDTEAEEVALALAVELRESKIETDSTELDEALAESLADRVWVGMAELLRDTSADEDPIPEVLTLLENDGLAVELGVTVHFKLDDEENCRENDAGCDFEASNDSRAVIVIDSHTLIVPSSEVECDAAGDSLADALVDSYLVLLGEWVIDGDIDMERDGIGDRDDEGLGDIVLVTRSDMVRALENEADEDKRGESVDDLEAGCGDDVIFLDTDVTSVRRDVPDADTDNGEEEVLPFEDEAIGVKDSDEVAVISALPVLVNDAVEHSVIAVLPE